MANATNILFYWTALIQKIARTSQITGFIILLVSVNYSTCFGNESLARTAERAAIEAQSSLQTKDTVFKVQSDTTAEH